MSLLIPEIAYAADDLLSIKELMFRVSFYIINPLIIFGFVVALVYFIWGVLDFLRKRELGSDKAADGKSHMLYGTIGMIIMVSAFAIMRVLADIVGADADIINALPRQ
jgi:hypothetical protein